MRRLTRKKRVAHEEARYSRHKVVERYSGGSQLFRMSSSFVPGTRLRSPAESRGVPEVSATTVRCALRKRTCIAQVRAQRDGQRQAGALLDDARRHVEDAVAAGVDANLDVWMGMPHGFVTGIGTLSAATRALRETGTF